MNEPPRSGDARPRSSRGGYWKRDGLWGYAFAGPQAIGFAIFVVAPIVAVMWYSLHDWNLIDGTFEFVGPGNFVRLAGDRELGPVAIASLLFALGYVPLNVGLGLAAAVAVDRATMGVGFFRTIYFSPVVVSLVAWALVWRFILQNDGVLNGLLAVAGAEGPNWLREPGPAMLMVILVQVLKSAGFSMVLFLAALQSVPREYDEAARVDGASSRQVFRRITIPLITPFIFLVIVLSVITSLKSFALIYLMTRGGPGNATTVLAYYIYETGFQRFDMGYASAVAVVLFLVVLVLTAGQFAIRKRWVFNET